MPTMTHWNDRVYFSVAHDANVARVSGYDEHSQEHFMIVETGKGFAERRRDALAKIQDAIEDGHEPGEVIYES